MGSADERLYSGRSTKAEPKPPSFRGAIVVDQTRGSLRIRAWPRKRGTPKHPDVIRTTGWFSWTIRAWNVLPSRVRMDAAAMAHRTPWLPRDLWLAAMAGRLWAIDLEDGTTIWPMAAIHTLSESLDILTKTPGALIARGASLWVPIDPGPAGYVLTSSGPDAVPSWQPSAAAGDAPSSRPSPPSAWQPLAALRPSSPGRPVKPAANSETPPTTKSGSPPPSHPGRLPSPSPPSSSET